ncbi:MAG: hypothetical protein KKD92_11350 [Proteobacteria bacterium]|nr:hypothetical protein [Pseudomonadota bacterium]
MKDEDRKKTEEIMAGIQCPKNFKCAESGLDHLCKAEDFGAKDYLDCLEKNPSGCPFAVLFRNSHLCHCPLRVYLSKKLKK